MYDFKELIRSMEDAAAHYKRELAGIRTGKATPAILDGVKVESYGTVVPLNQVGSVTIENARSLRVSPWDQSQVHAIERAISDAELGVSVSSDEKGVRVSFPELTSDRRDQLVKLTRAKLEESRTSVRLERDRVWQDIQKQEKDKLMSEDDKFRAKEQMEKLVKDGNDALEELAKHKEDELHA
jgi:ribosome recycling factor